MSKDKKQFMIIEKEMFLGTPKYSIHRSMMYDLTTAIKKMLALDTLVEDRERYSYHLQEVSFSEVQEPLILNDEVKEDKEQMDMPF